MSKRPSETSQLRRVLLSRRGSQSLASCLVAIVLGGCAAEPDGLHGRSRPTISPDGQSILVSLNVAGRSSIFKFDRTGASGIKVPASANAVEPILSANGRRLAFVVRESNDSGYVAVGDATGQSTQPLAGTDSHVMDALPLFLDDGRIAFFRSTNLRRTSTLGTRWIEWRLFMWDPATRLASPTSVGPFRDLYGATACGSTVWLGTSRDAGPLVVVLRVSDGETVVVGEWPGMNNPAAFPGCSRVVGIANVGTDEKSSLFKYELVTRSTQDVSTTQLTDEGSYLVGPAVAPDGQTVLFMRDDQRDNTYTLQELNLRTGDQRFIGFKLK